MRKKRCLKFIYLTCLILCLSVSVKAGFWEFFAPYKGPRKDIITLMITGNYTKPRLMADLIQTSTRQPYLLISAKDNGKVFFVPAKGKALEVSRGRVGRFVNFINPRQILVLGNEKFVAEKFVKLVGKRYPIVRVYNENWDKVAATVSSMFDLPHLTDDFKELCAEIDAGNLYTPDRSVAVGELKQFDVEQDVDETPEATAVEPKVGELEIDEVVETSEKEVKDNTGANQTVEETEAFLQIKENYNSESELIEDNQ